MCRMIAFVGGKDADLQGLYAAFRQGSQCDPFVKAAFGAEYHCHPDGWGYALYDGLQLHHFRSSRPVWEDALPLPVMQGSYVYGIFHSRMASNPALNAPFCSHPFIASTEKEILLLAHNGGIHTDPTTPPSLVDSEWALELIAQRGLQTALPLLKERTKANSALNLIVLSIPRAQDAMPMLHCLNFFKTENPARQAYYTMYRADLGGLRAFFSSTFQQLDLKGLTNAEVAPFGELFTLQALPSPGARPKSQRFEGQSVNT